MNVSGAAVIQHANRRGVPLSVVGSAPIVQQAVTSLAITAPVSGTYPYEAAVYFLRGDVPPGYVLDSLDDSTLRASILSTWDDGSASMVVVAGAPALTANYVKTVVLRPVTSASGSNLTTAAIASVMSSVAVNFVGYGGTATLSSFTTPERIWWANPQVICARYRLPAPTPGSTQLEAVIDIHAYAIGRAFVEVVIENSKVAIGSATAPAAATYTGLTVSINGSTIATVSKPATVTVRSLSIYQTATHQEFRAFYASGWVGGDPAVSVTHDTGYLQRHPLLFQVDQPTNQNFTVDQNGFGYVPSTMTYTPWTIAEQRPSMAAAGDDVSIGPLTKWDTQYLQSGNRNIRNAVIVNALACLSYPINYRDSTTGLVPTFDQINSAGITRGSGLPQLPYGSGTTTSYPYWEEEHPPSVGLMAFLVRPSPVFIELAQKAGFFAHTWTNADGGYNASWAGRAKSWGTRNLAHAMFLTPSQMPSGGSRANSEVTNWRTAAQSCLGRLATASYTSWVASPKYTNPLHIMYIGTPNPAGDEAREVDGGGVAGFQTAYWMENWAAVEWHKIDKARLLTGTPATNLSSWMDWALQATPQMVNDSAGGEWRYQSNQTTIGTGGASDNFTDVNPLLYANWATAFATRAGGPPALAGTWFVKSSSAAANYSDFSADTLLANQNLNYGVHFYHTLAAAKERGVTGASTAWSAVQANVTNLTTWRTGFASDPREGIYPRTLSGSNYVNPNWPAWRRALVPGTWTKVGTTMDATANAESSATLNPAFGSNAPWHGINGFQSIVSAWGGAVYNAGRLWAHGGGHADYGGNEVLSIDLTAASPAWRFERPPTGWKGGASEGITLNDGQESTRQYSNGDPRSSHTYDLMAWGNGGLYVMHAAVYSSGSEGGAVAKIHKFTPGANPTVGTDASFGSWALTATHTVTGYNWTSSSLAYDSTRNYLYLIGSSRPIYRYDITNAVWLAPSPNTGTDSDLRSVFVPGLDLVVMFNWAPSGNFQVYKPSANTIHTPGATGVVPAPTRSGAGSSVLEYWSAANWVPEMGAFVCWIEGGSGFHTLTPPASGDPTTTAWVWGRLEASAANAVTPDLRQSNGDYGRFFYSPELRCLGVVTSTTGQINIFALN